MVGRLVALVRALGPTLGVALLVLALSAWAFGALVEEVVEEDTLGVDKGFAGWLHDRATPALTDFFRAVTALGNVPTLVTVSVVAVVVLAWRRYAAEAALVVLAFGGAEILTLGLKLGFRRERPFFPDPLATESSFSFPSGHSTVSMAVYGALAVVAARFAGTHGRRVAAFVAAGAIVAGVGFSRLYLGVHYLSDVLAGFSLGAAWLALCVLSLGVWERRRAPGQTSRYRASTRQYSP